MGIKNLHNLLRKLCPHVYNNVPLSKYAFKKVAIDLSLFMCKYKTSYGSNWLDGFLQMISVLRYNDIHFVIVYDNKAPPEKDQERKQRSEARAKSRLRVERLQQAWDDFKQQHIRNEETTVEMDLFDTTHDLFHFVQKLSEGVHEKNVMSTVRVENELNRLRQSLLSIKSEEFDLTRELFEICGIPTMLAEGEAEATCAALNRQGYVSAVVTDDTDVLAYTAPTMLCKLDFQTNTCIELDYQEILSELQLQPEEFLDLCIMCGTDYNTNVPKLGCDRSYKLIRQYKSIENIMVANPSHSYECLNFIRVRELFHHPLSFTNEVPFCDFPCEKKITSFCFMHNCKFDVNHLMRSCTVSQYHDFDLEQEPEKDTTINEKNKNLLLTNKINLT